MQLFSPDFIPALVLASQLASANMRVAQHIKLLNVLNSFEENPHPDLVSAYLALQPGKSALQSLKLVQKLTSKNRTHLKVVSRSPARQSRRGDGAWRVLLCVKTPKHQHGAFAD